MPAPRLAWECRPAPPRSERLRLVRPLPAVSAPRLHGPVRPNARRKKSIRLGGTLKAILLFGRRRASWHSDDRDPCHGPAQRQQRLARTCAPPPAPPDRGTNTTPTPKPSALSGSAKKTGGRAPKPQPIGRDPSRGSADWTDLIRKHECLRRGARRGCAGPPRTASSRSTGRCPTSGARASPDGVCRCRGPHRRVPLPRLRPRGYRAACHRRDRGWRFPA